MIRWWTCNNGCHNTNMQALAAMMEKKKENTRPSFMTLLLQKVKEIAGSTPAIITGDFNAEPADEL